MKSRLILVILLCLAPFRVQAQSSLSGDQSERETDIPEEVLETEIILEGRSPIDGSPLSPADYAQLQEALRVSNADVPGRLAPKLHRAVVLLRLRKVLSTVFPFLF